MKWFWRSRKPVVGAPTVIVVDTPKPWSYLFNELSDGGVDLRAFGPTHVCVCGNDQFAVVARFHDHQIAFYLLDGRCLACGSYLIVPCEADVT